MKTDQHAVILWRRMTSAAALWAMAAGLCLSPLDHGLAAAPFAADGITEPFLNVRVCTHMPGIVSARNFKEGELVKTGDVIVEFDKQLEELETSRRKLLVESKKTDLDQARLLFTSSKGTSKDEVRKAELEYQVAEVEHRIAMEQLRRRVVTSPLTGYLTDYYVEVGEASEAFDAVARLVDTRRVYFVCNIEAKAAAELKLDQSVKLALDTGAGKTTVPAKIVYLASVVDPASGLLKVKALFDNPDNRIRPGLSGIMRTE